MYCRLQMLHSIMIITHDDWQFTGSNNLTVLFLLLLLVNVVVLLIPFPQLHFGFPHASQPLGTRVLLTVLNLVLTSLSRRLIGRL